MSQNEFQIALIREQTGCSLTDAVKALALRDGILTFAIEYLERRDINSSMSLADRFPKWTQYQTQKRRV
jgi:hypothetical protein